MRYRWPEDTQFKQVVLPVEQEVCSLCQRHLHVCDHRFHRILSLQGPLELVCKLAHCPDRACPAHRFTLSPLAEAQLTLPWWLIGWDVFCWLGFRRFRRHWSIPQLQAELQDSYRIRLSDDAISGYLQRYRCMVAARHQDQALLAEHYKDIASLVLTIDGLQPEKGHETLYVVRELRGKRVWFAEALLSSSADEVRRLITKAKDWAQQLGLPVELWMSDKQDAFLSGIAVEFPDVPHRYCHNHFLRDLAKPLLEKDSHAKVQMRKKVRGLRDIEKQVLEDRRKAQDEAEQLSPASASTPALSREPVAGSARASEPVAVGPPSSEVAFHEPATSRAAANAAEANTAGARVVSTASPQDSKEATAAAGTPVEPCDDEAGAVVLDYCAAVRGILNDDQGGPLHPPGLRMAEALQEVRESLQRSLDAKKGGARRSS
jgi:GNAT superfamily N-acetyltransferase